MHNKKIMSLLCIIGGLTACGGTGSSTPQKADESTANQKNKLKIVTISRTSTIPTNSGSIGKHFLTVNNFTGKNLRLNSVEVSGKNGLVNRSINFLNRAFGGAGYDSRVNYYSCNNLQASSTCTLQFTPDEMDGATSVRLNYVDSQNKEYVAAQLVDYSSDIVNNNGFLLNNAHIGNIASTTPYSIAIPFVADDDFSSVEVSSDIMTISKSVDCSNGVRKGSHCTALLTFPAGPAEYYDSNITIRGTKNDGSIREAVARSGNTYNDFAHLSINNGSLVLDAKNGITSATLQLVNVGTAQAKNISDKIVVDGSSVNGINGKDNHVKTTYSCGGNKDKTSLAAALGSNDLDSAQACEIKFTLDNPNAFGTLSYSLMYQNGAGGNSQSKSFTNIYYLGLGEASSNFFIKGKLDFTNSQQGSSLKKIITVQNNGKNELSDIKVQASTKINIINNGCENTTLNTNETCNITAQYQAPNTEEDGTDVLEVVAKDNARSEIKRTVTVPYSTLAVGAGNNLLISPKDVFGLAIVADGTTIESYIVSIQNVGNTEFTIAEYEKDKYPTGLTIGAAKKLSDNTTENPLEGLKKDVKLKAKESGELIFSYGPLLDTDLTADEIFGRADTLLKGKFAGSQFDYSSTPIVVDYKAVKTTVAGYIKTKVVIDQGNYVPSSTKVATASMTYSTVSNPGLTGFRVTSSNIPVGWIEDLTAAVPAGSTRCPTTNNGLGDINANTIKNCVVQFAYAPANPFAGSAFHYTSFVDGIEKELRPLGYTIKGIPDVGIIVVEEPKNGENSNNDLSAKFKPTTFAGISVLATKVATAITTPPPGYDEYDVEFSATSNDPGVGDITIKPYFDNNDNALSVSSTSCDIASPTTKCTIKMHGKTGAGLPFVAIDGSDPTYRMYDGVINFN